MEFKKRLWKKISSLALVSILAISITGCGNSASTSTDASNVTVVKVGTGNSMPPFCSLDSNGNVVGYDVDVLKELDNRLTEYKFDIQSMDFTTLLVSIDSGALDVVSHQLVKSDARKQKYLFPEQYYCLSPLSLAVKKDSGIKTLSDLKGKSINESPSSYEYSLLTSYSQKTLGNSLKINAVSDLSSADNFKQVANGQVDAALTYQSTYKKIQDDLKLDNITLTDTVLVEDTYIMLAKGQEKLTAAINQALKDMLNDGTLAKIAKNDLSEDVFANYTNLIQTTN